MIFKEGPDHLPPPRSAPVICFYDPYRAGLNAFHRTAVQHKPNRLFYQSPLILTELFQHNLINVSYLTACYLYQVMMTLHFLNDVANDGESTQK